MRPGRVEALERELAALPKDDESPLARLEATHFARWAIIDPLARKGGDPVGSTHYLLFTSWFDGPVEDYLGALCDLMPVEADAIWSNCDGYPGLTDRCAFTCYLVDHHVKPGLSAAGNPAPVERVRRALRLREDICAFVLESRRLDDDELQRRWRARFPGDGRASP